MVLVEQWRGKRKLRLMDIGGPETAGDLTVEKGDISDLGRMQSLCQGVHTVVHLAADPRTSAPWESLLSANIIGLYNVFEAARQAGCRRVVYASTVNVIAHYPREIVIEPDMPVAPANLYGATKAWGEAAAYYYAHYHNLSVLCLRLGWVISENDERIRPGQPLLPALLTYRDTVSLFDAAVNARQHVHFGIFHGQSDNRIKRMSIENTRQVLGYEPVDDAYVLAGIPDS